LKTDVLMLAPQANPSADSSEDIMEAVRALCAHFPGEYWRVLDRERGYPTEFVNALTQQGSSPA
jgi:acyl-CoA dehydrogenase